MPENFGQIAGIEVVLPCELDTSVEYTLVLKYDTNNCHWIFEAQPTEDEPTEDELSIENYDRFGDFPATGRVNVIYVDDETGKTYVWDVDTEEYILYVE